MAGAALHGRLSWRLAQIVESIPETGRVKTLLLDVPEWPGHKAGQHLDIRLTAEDGYQAQRSYSIATAPEAAHVGITVERIEDGEVSPYLVDDLQPGDSVEVRGPIGGYFTWTVADGGPLFLVAGGSGVVPLMAMLRHRAAAKGSAPARLLFSSRSQEDVIYRGELERLTSGGGSLRVIHTLTREQPPGWKGYARRIDRAMIEEIGWPASERPLTFICGPTRLVESAAAILTDLGHEPGRIKTERFGPTGGPDGVG